MTGRPRFVLLVQCPDTRGIVAAISGYLADNACSITEFSHFNDALTGRFFMRTVFVCEDREGLSLDSFRIGFKAIAGKFHLDWSLHDSRCGPR